MKAEISNQTQPIAQPGSLKKPAKPSRNNGKSMGKKPVKTERSLGNPKWRLRPESNRRTRFCKPMHNHFATQP
jgi:hypothetical protein